MIETVAMARTFLLRDELTWMHSSYRRLLIV